MGDMGMLVAAVACFVVTHLVLASPPVRTPLVVKLGERGFRAVYSVVAIVLIVWVASAYNGAPYLEVWAPPIGLKHLALPIVALAAILVVAGLSTPNPSALGGNDREIVRRGPVGILKVTRHPVMWGIALWGIAHLLANGDLAGMILFGGMIALALAGARAQDAKKRSQLGPDWDAFARQTAFVPFAAVLTRRTRLSLGEVGGWRVAAGLGVFAMLFTLHPWLFGVSPLPF